MCGVVGMIGAGKVQETLITGLEKLEYRGYDSAGIFVRNNETVGFFKEVGRIAQLKEIVDFDLPATVGLPTGQLPNTMLTHIYPLAVVLP